MPDEEEFPSRTMMKQIHYMISPLHHAASDQEEAQSEGERQQSPGTAALLAEEYHQGPHQEKVAPAPPAPTQSPIDRRISEMRYQGSFGNSGRRIRKTASLSKQMQLF
jgi:hypothetical protein